VASHGVARHRVLDLDDVGAPVADDRAPGGHEPPLGDFEHANSVEQAGHGLDGWQGAREAARLRLRMNATETARIRPGRPDEHEALHDLEAVSDGEGRTSAVPVSRSKRPGAR